MLPDHIQSPAHPLALRVCAELGMRFREILAAYPRPQEFSAGSLMPETRRAGKGRREHGTLDVLTVR